MSSYIYAKTLAFDIDDWTPSDFTATSIVRIHVNLYQCNGRYGVCLAMLWKATFRGTTPGRPESE